MSSFLEVKRFFTNTVFVRGLHGMFKKTMHVEVISLFNVSQPVQVLFLLCAHIYVHDKFAL